ncbi:hypothetical protein PoB_006251400 [Plakobranchus ocellatus]|uniref:Uncharacterized protein n=1 Tax=Plakobranchus ocellatus TaxID=259542 RepID=A0AAV4CVU5_9GAST|nr:hypothetical protein PoB_006251400 [Plakobranchus ocellatus]
MPNLRSGTSTRPAQSLAPAVAQVVVMERERCIIRFYGDEPAAASEFEEEIRLAWATIPAPNHQHRLDILLSNVDPIVKAELRFQPQDVQKGIEKALGVILEVFGKRRTPAQLLQNLLTLRQLLPVFTSIFPSPPGAYLSLAKRQGALREPPYPDRFLRDPFIAGLWDQSL